MLSLAACQSSVGPRIQYALYSGIHRQIRTRRRSLRESIQQEPDATESHLSLDSQVQASGLTSKTCQL